MRACVRVHVCIIKHVHSTLALRKQKEKKGKVTHPTIAQTNKHIIERDTWTPSLDWGGGLKIFCG